MKHHPNPDPKTDVEAKSAGETAEKVESDLAERLIGVPRSPGVYLMKDKQGRVIYVGKASNLKNRLASYFSKSGPTDYKTGMLVRKIADFETVLTATENEALILESNLIKRHRPRYNVILKDDKRYPSLRIDPCARYPNLTVVRKIKKDGALYFGPYSSAGALRETLRLINRNFRLRKCRHAEPKPRSRPCLNFQINACPAPCARDVDPQQYREIMEEVRMLLSGRAVDLVRKIKKEMTEAAERQAYEAAAQLRDKMIAVNRVVEKQVAVTTDFTDRDAVAVARTDDLALILVATVRNGHVQGMKDYTVSDPETLSVSGDGNIIGAFISQYYDTPEQIPREIIVASPVDDTAMYNRLLGGIKGRKVDVIHPKRGSRVRLAEMASTNAAERLRVLNESARSASRLLEGIQKKLHLPAYPHRIECIDNSGTRGTEMVSGIVVFENGEPKKSDYRKYRLRGLDLQDDYAAMAETLERRFTGGSMEGVLPDLLLVDGGKGQLNIVVSLLKKLGGAEQVPVAAIAKKNEEKQEPEDKIFVPGRANPVNFTAHTAALRLLQSIRDEAHRYAITFHRKRRNTRAMVSVLDDIPGIGEKRKNDLLKHFGSIDAMAASGIDEIAALPSMNRKAAADLQAALQKRGGSGDVP